MNKTCFFQSEVNKRISFNSNECCDKITFGAGGEIDFKSQRKVKDKQLKYLK